MNTQPPATLRDVAEEAGVSTAAASIALRDLPGVSKATRDRVHEIAKRLGYQANVSARNLRRGSTGNVGLLLPPGVTTLTYYMEFMRGVVDTAATAEYATLLFPNTCDLNRWLAQVDGVITIDVAEDDPCARRVLEGAKPVVACERVPASLPQPDAVVAIDHVSGTRELFEHLYEQGARKIAAVVPPGDTVWGAEVLEAIGEFETDHEITVRQLRVPFAASPEDIEQACINLSADVDAVAGISDGSAVSLASVFQEQGRRIGQDVLLASYVDSGTHHLLRPKITGFDHAPRDLGATSLDLLLSILRGEEVPAETLTRAVMERRDSTAAKLTPAS